MIQKREEMKDNRGFSLVELIIVIAIMAILVAVLAPQFLKYVEQSRNSADKANAKEIENTISAYFADTTHTTSEQIDGITIVEVRENGCKIVDSTGGTKANVLAALKESGILKSTDTVDNGSLTCRSKTKWKAYSIKITVTGEKIDFTYMSYPKQETPPSTHHTNDEFAESFQQTGFIGSVSPDATSSAKL